MGGGPYGGPTIPAVEGTTRTSSCSSPCCTLQARDALFAFLGCRNMVASPRGGGIRHQIMYIADPALPLVPAIAWRGGLSQQTPSNREARTLLLEAREFPRGRPT